MQREMIVCIVLLFLVATCTCQTVCKPWEYKCPNDGSCIDIAKSWCDGQIDCTDYSDEPDHCVPGECPAGGVYLKCNNKCIPQSTLCDFFTSGCAAKACPPPATLTVTASCPQFAGSDQQVVECPSTCQTCAATTNGITCITCSPGHRLEGIECIAVENWCTSDTDCPATNSFCGVDYTCKFSCPSLLQDALINNYTLHAYYPGPGGYAAVKCLPGRTFADGTSAKSISCQSSGSWNSLPGKCAASCPGSNCVTCSDSGSGLSCESCAAGYTLDGTTGTCNAVDNWCTSDTDCPATNSFCGLDYTCT